MSLTNNAGGIYVGYSNNYYGGDGNDTIEITGSNSWAAFQAFNSGNSIETIKGDGAGDAIVAGQNVQTGNAYGVLDLSSTTLINIAQIRGTSAADDITGSKGADTVSAGDGNDTIRESGGADLIDGGTGTNTFVAKFASTAYKGSYTGVNGTHNFNNGTSWKITDSTGATVTLTNIQNVQFTDKTLTSTSNNVSTMIGLGSAPSMKFIAPESMPARIPDGQSALSQTDLRSVGVDVGQSYRATTGVSQTSKPIFDGPISGSAYPNFSDTTGTHMMLSVVHHIGSMTQVA